MEHERGQLSALIDEWEGLVNQALERINELNEDELVEFVDQKAELVNKIMSFRNVVSEEDKQIISVLTQQEQAIVSRMEALKEDAAEWLSRRGMIRSQSQAYNNSYSMDSLFIDRRK